MYTIYKRVIYSPFCVPIVDWFSRVPGVRFVDKFLEVVSGYGGVFPNFSFLIANKHCVIALISIVFEHTATLKKEPVMKLAG